MVDKAAPLASKMSRTQAWFASVGILVGFLLIDQSTKTWVRAHLDTPTNGIRDIVIWKGRLAITLAKNRGGAWASQGPDEARYLFFGLLSIIIAVLVLALMRTISPERRAIRLGLLAFAGGAIGNFVDRACYGYVTDFIDVQFTPSAHWPTFNIADVAIVSGVLLCLVGLTGRLIADRRLPSDRDHNGSTDAQLGARLINIVVDQVLVFLLARPLSVPFIVMQIGYYLFFEGLFGRTPGKWITGTRLVREDGGVPRFTQVLGRTLTRCVPFEPFSFFGSGLGGWHDRWSGTRVISVSPGQLESPDPR